jgi:hypothetical protein
MRELVDELIDNAINAHSAADELERGIVGIAEDKMVAIEVRQSCAADAACELGGENVGGQLNEQNRTEKNRTYAQT